MNPCFCVTRGPSQHSDYGVTCDDYKENLLSSNGADYVAQFDKMMAQDHINAHTLVCFWRPVLPMKHPVKKMPMAFCDPASVKSSSMVPTLSMGVGSGPINLLKLLPDPDQKWYCELRDALEHTEDRGMIAPPDWMIDALPHTH